MSGTAARPLQRSKAMADAAAPSAALQGKGFAVAPMIDWTDRHCRYFHRQLSSSAVLYTEMITTGAILHGDRDRFLRFNAAEHPVVLQLGGSDPADLATCTRIACDYGYDQINLNIGCPSDRVQSGRFGACLMAEPDLVARCTEAMLEASDTPVTVKCRIGIDDQDTERDFTRFIDTVAASGVTTFIVHARKAWLKGLSPKENRDIPPLDYDRVHRLKAARPDLAVWLNGGLSDLAHAAENIGGLDGMMLGRAAYQEPWLLTGVDAATDKGAGSAPDRSQVINAMTAYAEARIAEGVPLNSIARHMLGLYNGLPGARRFRRYISENARGPHAGPEVLAAAAALVNETAAGSVSQTADKSAA